MGQTSNGLTIVDIAGSNHSHESALVILELLYKNIEMIEQIFGINKKMDSNKVNNSPTKGSKKKRKTWLLKVVNAKQLNPS